MTPPASELSEDDKRIWIQLWNTVHNDHYACYYEDLTAEFLVGRWRLVDTLTKFATALTASGSSVAAWALWATSKTGSITWAILSGLAALIALVHTSFSISDRMKDDTLIFATFVQLRLDLEAFKTKMRLMHYDSLTAFRNEYMEISAKFGKAHALKHPDFLLTKKKQIAIQKGLNELLGY